ncbi:MAG: penicillin-binding protein 2 [bacterium]|nr:penicillin-binding protein 2 [bacterium]
MANPFFLERQGIAHHKRDPDAAAFDLDKRGGAVHVFSVPKIGTILLIVASILLLLTFTVKTASVQLFSGEVYGSQALDNRTITYRTPSNRGVIYDRNQVVLAGNEPAFNMAVEPRVYKAEEGQNKTTHERILAILDENKRQEFAIGMEGEARFVIEGLSYESAMQLYANEEDWMRIEHVSARTYITDIIPSLSHVLGYTGPMSEAKFEENKEEYRLSDRIGTQGLEAFYESTLRGKYGKELWEIDALGNVERVLSSNPAVPGVDLHLSLDSNLQAAIETILTNRLEDHVASRGSVIALDPRTGEILAFVSWPSFDANAFTKGISEEAYRLLADDENTPLFPRASSGSFPTGSTIKPIFAAAALSEGIITPSTSFVSSGGIRVSEWFFPDWRAGGHGITDVYHAIADSVNTFFYYIGGGYDNFTGLGIETLVQYARAFNFGSKTGIDLPSESAGFLPSKEWKLTAKGEQWYIGDTYNSSIGQGDILATPLQVATATAIIANDGKQVRPHFISSDWSTNEEVIAPEIATVIKDAMRQTVTAGTATAMQGLPVAAAGKTGTAQWRSDRENHSWFTGFAPFEDPSFVITTLIEEGAEGALASSIARETMDWWFRRNIDEMSENP